MKEIIQRRQGGISITTIGMERRKEKRKQERRHDQHQYQYQAAKKPKNAQERAAEEHTPDTGIKQYFGMICTQHQRTGWINVTGEWKKVEHAKLMQYTFLTGKFESNGK